MFLHQVYFWLKPGTSDAAKRLLLTDCRTLLVRVPGVRELWAGEPAGTPREVVDNSYGVGLAIVFADRAAHDVYQAHPLHLDFIARNKEHWEKVRIFDFVTE